MASGIETDEDLIYQINTHLLYEVRWLIYAATEFAKGDSLHWMALIDSAAVHGRNLFEFAKLTTKRTFSLHSLGGAPQENKPWERFLNNRVTHMHSREKDRSGWPDGLDNVRQDRLVVMTQVALDMLQAGGAAIPSGDVRDGFDELLIRARAYLLDPTEAKLQHLAALYDDSRDNRPYQVADD